MFRALWIASLTSNVGTWMQSVAAVWLMTSLSSSPVMVALVQTAASLPLVFLALPAGALADMVDRRKLLLAAHRVVLGSLQNGQNIFFDGQAAEDRHFLRQVADP